MIYLVIGLAIGIVADRYLFPICDILLELFNYQVAKICTSIQIDTNIMSLEYEEIANQGNQLTPTIGFLSGEQNEEEIYDDEEDDEDEEEQGKLRNKVRIGFIK